MSSKTIEKNKYWLVPVSKTDSIPPNVQAPERAAISTPTSLSSETVNPVDELSYKEEVLVTPNSIFKIASVLAIVTFFSLSILFNNYFASKVDPVLISSISSNSLLAKTFQAPKNFIFNRVNQPFVVTVGEYSTLDLAKEKAKEILSTFRQININELPSGNYALELSRYSSKKDAQSYLTQLQSDSRLDSLMIRYIPKGSKVN